MEFSDEKLPLMLGPGSSVTSKPPYASPPVNNAISLKSSTRPTRSFQRSAAPPTEAPEGSA